MVHDITTIWKQCQFLSFLFVWARLKAKKIHFRRLLCMRNTRIAETVVCHVCSTKHWASIRGYLVAFALWRHCKKWFSSQASPGSHFLIIRYDMVETGWANERGSILAQFKFQSCWTLALQMQTDSINFNNPCSLLLDVKIYGRDLHLYSQKMQRII